MAFVAVAMVASTAVLGPGDALVVMYNFISSANSKCSTRLELSSRPESYRLGPTLTLTRYAIVLLETLQSGESLSVTDDGWVSETCAARHAVCRHSTLLRTAESTA